MKSEQATLKAARLRKREVTLLMLLLATLSGCDTTRYAGPDPLISPYAQRRVWAVAPLRNESGSLHADGLRVADQLTHHLTNATNIEMLPVNRVLRAMEALEIAEINTPADAARIMQTLGADGLIVGTITAYEPYDPPHLGLTIELFDGGVPAAFEAFDAQMLSRAMTDEQTHPYDQGGHRPAQRRDGVASTVGAFFDAADADVRKKIQRYAGNRSGDGLMPPQDNWHRYRMSVDLYSEFVTYVMSWRLLRAETRRIAQLITANKPQASRENTP